uniref:Protein phosphatase 1, regulatory (inhibitor) subunit 14C n=1 Tax=Kryptolebias marmoratus TaxID=37003 RepID=A0A3Q3AIJ4_KRYMA
MSAASTKTSASPLPSDNSHVFFQVAPPVVNCERSAPPIEKKQGKVTVRYDRKELRKRLELEEWIVDSLADLYDCEEVSGEGGGGGASLYLRQHMETRSPDSFSLYVFCPDMQVERISGKQDAKISVPSRRHIFISAH